MSGEGEKTAREREKIIKDIDRILEQLGLAALRQIHRSANLLKNEYDERGHLTEDPKRMTVWS